MNALLASVMTVSALPDFSLVDSNCQPKAALIELLHESGMPKSEKQVYTLEAVNDWAQKNLIRNGERWESQNLKFDSLKGRITPLLEDLGFFKEVKAHFDKYDGVIIHGALLPRVRLRVKTLADAWNNGARFEELYFIGGARPLEPTYESKEAFYKDIENHLPFKQDFCPPEDLPKTEIEMMEWVWNQSELPENLKTAVKVHFINAPMKKVPGKEELVRPNTDDTIYEWLKSQPAAGLYLAITNQPYVIRQDLVIKALTPQDFYFDTVGDFGSEQTSLPLVLDEVARAIFQTLQIKQKNESACLQKKTS